MKNIEKIAKTILIAFLFSIINCSESDDEKEVYRGEILKGFTKQVVNPLKINPRFSFTDENLIYFSDFYAQTGEGSYKRKVFSFNLETYETKEFLDLNTKQFDFSQNEDWIVSVDDFGIFKMNLIDSLKYHFNVFISDNSIVKIDPKQKYIVFEKENFHSSVCVYTFEGDSLICFDESIAPSWHPIEEKLIFSKGGYFIVYDFEKSLIADTIWAIEGVLNNNPFYLSEGKEIVFENENGIWHINEFGDITNLFAVSDTFIMRCLSPNPHDSRSFLFQGFNITKRIIDFDPLIFGERSFYTFNVDSILFKK